jgi:hypothetical protein
MSNKEFQYKLFELTDEELNNIYELRSPDFWLKKDYKLIIINGETQKETDEEMYNRYSDDNHYCYICMGEMKSVSKKKMKVEIKIFDENNNEIEFSKFEGININENSTVVLVNETEDNIEQVILEKVHGRVLSMPKE